MISLVKSRPVTTGKGAYFTRCPGADKLSDVSTTLKRHQSVVDFQAERFQRRGVKRGSFQEFLKV
jgi:hypothetical protein